MNKRNDKDKKEINYQRLNELINLSNKFMKFIYVVCILAFLVMAIHVAKQTHIFGFIGEILSVLTAFFIGIIIAWLFDPIVTYLQEKGVKRLLGVLLIYVVLLCALIISGSFLIPSLTNQIKEIIMDAPDTISNLSRWFNELLSKLSISYNLDYVSVRENIYESLRNLTISFTVDIPKTIINVTQTIFNGGLNIIVGLIIGFYMLVDFDNVKSHLANIVPRKYRRDMSKLSNELNRSLRNYVYGTLIVVLILFIFQSIGMSIAGMRAPLVFGLFCAITNIIPYLGPYLGGIPSVVVAFTISPQVGIGVLISVFICQGLESYLLTPTIMSKTMKLHPVTIIIGLLLFGHFFGILGMLFATPIISCLKIITNFFIEKYSLFNTDEIDEDVNVYHEEDLELVTETDNSEF